MIVNKIQSIWDKNQDIPATRSEGGASGDNGTGRSNKNLSKSRKLKKRSKTNSTQTDFLTFRPKEAFKHL